jgi:hypothetical protein
VPISAQAVQAALEIAVARPGFGELDLDPRADRGGDELLPLRLVSNVTLSLERSVEGG